MLVQSFANELYLTFYAKKFCEKYCWNRPDIGDCVRVCTNILADTTHLDR